MDLGFFNAMKERLSLSHLSKPALVGIVVILVMVAVAAGRLLIGTATANGFEYVKGEASLAASEGTSGEAAEKETVFAHVTGEVSNPGLVEISAGSRVADAVQAAGGFTGEAAVESVNLARVVSDGEQIVVASQFQEIEPSASPALPDVPSASLGSSAGLVNINTAAASELVSLPGSGGSSVTEK